MPTTTETRVVVSAQIPRDARERLERMAAAGDRTLSREIERAVREYLAAREDEEDE